MKNFIDLGVTSDLLDALARLQISVPTSIQEAIIPKAMEGFDILASSQTGSGKTIAYLLPFLMQLKSNAQARALILAPTRELAIQVQDMLKKLPIQGAFVKSALLIGGAPMGKQLLDLKRSPQIVIGTPGRILDHLERKTLRLEQTQYFIIDEADRMMDMGFGIQLERIAEFLPTDRQTWMFSATLPPHVDKLTKKYLNNPEKITIDSKIAPPKIKEEFLHLKQNEKFNCLVKKLDEETGAIIVFVRTKRGADDLSEELEDLGYQSSAIHGDLPQRRRERVLKDFRLQKCRIIIATDVAARGLDIPQVKLVINYDLTQCAEDYVHRIGRTGRAGNEGSAISFVSPNEMHLYRAICRTKNPGQSFAKAPFPKNSSPFRPKKRFFDRNEGEKRSRPPYRDRQR